MAAWLKLVRWQNLVMIFVTMLAAWWGLGLGLTRLAFTFLAVSTTSIAAAGYIINDYYDVAIDAINRPGQVIIGERISTLKAKAGYAALNVTGLVCAITAANAQHNYRWLWVQAAGIGLLWLYSAYLKRQPVTGNLAVALVTAGLTAGMLAAYTAATNTAALAQYILAGYSLFAFLLTWVREMVKDMEDIKGDAAGGCHTLPVKVGLAVTARIILITVAVTLLPLFLSVFALYRLELVWLAGYVLLLIIVPTAVWGYFLLASNTSAHYHKASTRLKVIMLLGIGSLITYHFQLLYGF